MRSNPENRVAIGAFIIRVEFIRSHMEYKGT